MGATDQMYLMKKLFYALLVLSLAMSAVSRAESPMEMQLRQKQEVARANSEALNKKASKAARNEAKEMKKKGWETAPGALPIEKQLDKCYLLQYQTDAEGYPEYIMAEGMSVGANYDAAKMQATEIAKQNIAGLIQSNIAAMTKTTIGNDQLGGYDAESVTRTESASINSIKAALGRVIVVTEVYRMVGNGRREVLVRIAYPQKQVDQITRSSIKKGLEEGGEELHKRLDNMSDQ